MLDIERVQLVAKVKEHINFIFDIQGMDKKSAVDQAYGFVQGVMFAHKDDEVIYTLLADLWTDTMTDLI